MIIGKGSTTEPLTPAEAQLLVAAACDPLPLDGKRVLVIIPDGTRTAPIPLMFGLLCEQLAARVARLDYLIALGTHPLMSEQAIDRLVGMPAAERAERYPNVTVFNHRWDLPATLKQIGTIPARELRQITGGLIEADVPVTLNRAIFEYDQIVICGPVFPHEVAGFSGGAKYLFPGIAAGAIINTTHWLGALVTSYHTIGVKDTPIRRVIHRAAEFVDRPILCLAMVMRGHAFHGLYAGPHQEAWSAAADLSAQLNIFTVPRAFRQVLAMPSTMYADLWTAAKAMYKTEPAIVKQWDRFKDVPGSILAHSTHVKGAGSYDPATGVERPRIQVTLATGIPAERCRRVNLGYADYRTIDPQSWANREDEGLLFVPHAGEVLYRAADLHVE